jgi:hypothetical protein
MRASLSGQPTWRTNVRAALVVALVAGIASACDDNNSTGPNGVVVVSNVQLKAGTEAGPLAVATFDVQHADSARAWYSTAGGDPVPTQFAPVSDGSSRFVVTGLEPATQYQIYIEGRSGPDSTVSQPADFTTDALPDALENVSFNMSTGTFTPGFILTEVVAASDSTLYAVAFDSTGKLAWYRRFPDFHQILDLQQQPNGHYTIYLGGSTGWQPVEGKFAEFDVAGNITHEWKLPDQYFVDGHELRFTMEDTAVTAAYLFGYDLQPLDMSGHGGGPDSLVAVHKIFRLSPGGDATLLFDAIDRWTLDDWTSQPLTGLGDLGHANSLDLDTDGNLIVSWRNLGAVTKHDINTGEVIWQLGGTKSDFTIDGDPLNGFSGQHFARALPDDHLMVYDNGTNHEPAQSRVVEFAIDAANTTATFVREFKRPTATFTTFLGSAQRLPNGHTFAGFGNVSVVTEFDANGNVVADGTKMDGGTPSIFYRALWIPTLGNR